MAKQRQTSDNRRSRTQALATSLYTAHHRRLLAIGKRNSPTTEDAEEALHDTFILFINHFDPANGAPPLAWLTLTLKRRCWATYRRQQLLHRQQPLPNGDPSAADAGNELLDPSRLPDELAVVSANVSEARHKINQLKPDERRALSLLAIGYSYREICDLTGWTYTKVNRCISEGRAALRGQKSTEGAKTPR
jgi:DNA-directed RNA polymerase specialized sigma24 family protein